MDILDKERLKECRLKLGITKQEAAKGYKFLSPHICDMKQAHVILLYKLLLKWLKFFQHLQITSLGNLLIRLQIE